MVLFQLEDEDLEDRQNTWHRVSESLIPQLVLNDQLQTSAALKSIKIKFPVTRDKHIFYRHI